MAMNAKGAWIPHFLKAFAELGVQTDACAVACVHPSTVYRRLETDHVFAQQFKFAKREARDVIRSAVLKLGVKGQLRKKFTSNGEPIMDPETGKQYVEVEHSAACLLAAARAYCPEFKDKSTLKHTGSNGGPINLTHTFNLRNLTSEELDNLERIMLNANRRAGIPDTAEPGRN
jgi:hypothetical protein